jgi:hypothetical protein
MKHKLTVKEQRDLFREAIITAQFSAEHWGDAVCPWCVAYTDEPHAPECVVLKAVASRGDK